MDSREKIILPYIRNKEVLDFGPGDINYRFLHEFIVKNSKMTIGVELDKKRASRLRKRGYDIINGNAEDIKLNKKFDTIIAGDLIEHLNNPGNFLRNVRTHLKKDGVFIFNTPNIYSINNLLRGIFLGKVRQFDEHTMGFAQENIEELLKRENFKIIDIIYFSHKEKNINNFTIRILSFLSKRWKEHMIIVAK